MNNISKLQEQFENLIKQGQELLEKIKERVADTSKTKRWKPKDGETYWYIYGDGTIDCDSWTSKNDIVLGRYKVGNYFKTEEEAQKELDRRIAEQELLDLCDWESGEWVCIRYDVGRKLFDFASFGFLVYSPYRFASLTSCNRAINTLGTEKLKLIFRID